MLVLSQNKVFRGDPSFIKDMHISWENSVIVTDKKFHVEKSLVNDMFIWFFLSCLFDGWTYPTNTSRGFHVETTWKRSFLCRFNVESMWCVYRVVQFHFVIIIIRVNDEKGNIKLYFLKDVYLKMFT